MAIYLGVASFRSASDPRSFFIHVGEEEYVTIDKNLFCTRFHLLESTLLVERNEFDDSGAVSKTVYVRSISIERGWHYMVGAGSYTLIGVESRFNVSQPNALSPQSLLFIEHERRRPRMSLMPFVVEVPEHSVEELSLDDNSNTAIVVLDYDSEEQTILISSPKHESQ